MRVCKLCGIAFHPFYREVFGHEYKIDAQMCEDCFNNQVLQDAIRLAGVDEKMYFIQRGMVLALEHGGFLE